MSASEIVIIALTTLGLLFGIIKVWIRSKTDIAGIQTQIEIDIAKIRTQIVAIEKKQDEHEKDLLLHKQEDEKRFEQFHKENREDHQIMFKKVDNILQLLNNK